MEFRDLKKQYQVLKEEIDAAILEVCQETKFISGPQVHILESQLAEYIGTKYCISCANGTDALTLALMAWGVGKGDAVFVPDFTFFSSGECPAALGAIPIFVDVDAETYNIDPYRLEEAIVRVKKEGKYVPKAVVTVDLFGLPADYPKILDVCKRQGLYLLEDGAQGFGGEINGKKACSFGNISTTSFFPAKPLGCFGDGGAVFTDNEKWAELIRSFAVHGKGGKDKYNNIRIGMNSRLDTLQAAILLVKLKAFREYELRNINEIARLYNEKLRDSKFILPKVPKGFISSWAQYTIQLPYEIDREELQNRLKKESIPSSVYYVRPMHKQGAFVNTDSALAKCVITEELCGRVLSLPIHPYMTNEMVDVVCTALKKNI